MMDESKIYLKLAELFSEVLDQDSIVLEAATTAADVDGWDSLAHVRLMLETEKVFGIRFDTAEITDIANVGELASLISIKLT